MRNIENCVKKVQSFKGPLSKSIIVGTAKATLNQLERGWIKDSVTVRLMGVDGVFNLIENTLINRELDEDLTCAGIEFLNKFLFTKKGEPRKTKMLKFTALNDPGFFDAVKDFSHFTFGGFHNISENHFSQYHPIWIIHSKCEAQYAYVYTGGPFGSREYPLDIIWSKGHQLRKSA